MNMNQPIVRRRQVGGTAGEPKPPFGKRPGDGGFIGWCNRCGADVFDGPRHRCPPRLKERATAAIMAAKLYRDARAGLACASGEFARRQAGAKEQAAFDTLVAVLAALDEGATILEENAPATSPVDKSQPA